MAYACFAGAVCLIAAIGLLAPRAGLSSGFAQSPPPEGSAAADRGGPRKGAALPLVAIIIDDMGYHQRIGRALLDLDLNLTFSFLPDGPFTPALQERAWREEHDVLVHMPMEAHDPARNSGPGTLLADDPPEVIAEKVARNLATVPRAVGVNNHMGSRFTENPEAVQLFLHQIAAKGLFFIDSGTTPRSVAMETARSLGIPTGRRHVFLDNSDRREDICLRLGELVELAVRSGEAIGIGHPGEATLEALNGCGEMLTGRVRVVGIGELAR
ncbi:MAG: divergent polysaccharide deacetylase family protein [Desulfobulbaceae bacterium]|nr:divergent polysaccharide deacetylase family protein [Desulfobulbaceae bacterium]MDY0351991.1 divergent polysaccharide deacetylase family protein [Desulfobulbaceae bacterium]